MAIFGDDMEILEEAERSSAIHGGMAQETVLVLTSSSMLSAKLRECVR